MDEENVVHYTMGNGEHTENQNLVATEKLVGVEIIILRKWARHKKSDIICIILYVESGF